MPIYLNTNNKLKEVEEKVFKLERDIQRVFEGVYIWLVLTLKQ